MPGSFRQARALALAWVAGMPLATAPAALAQGTGFSNVPRPAAPAPSPGGAGTPNRPASAPPAAIPPAAIPAPSAPTAAAPPAAPRPPSATAAIPPAAPAAPVAGPFSVTESAGGFLVQNLGFSLGPVTYLIARADVRGSAMSRDELTRVLDPASPMKLADRVNRLSASDIAIPELVSETGGGAVRQTTTYRDVRLSGIGGGRIASLAASAGTFAGSSGSDRQEGGFGRIEIADADLGFAVALMDEKATAGGPEAMRRLYGSFSIDGLSSRDGKGATARVARMSGRDLAARRTPEGWGATFGRFVGQHDLNALPAGERREVVGAIVDLLDAFEFGSLEATGIEFREPGAKDSAGRIARIAYTGAARGSSEFRIEGFEAGRDEGRVRLSSFSLGGFSLSPALKAAKEMAGADPTSLTPADLRRLVPAIGSIRVSGIDVEAGDKSGAVSVGSMEILADKPVESIPTDLRVAVRNIAMPIGPNPTDDGLQQLKSLGYDKLDGSFVANVGWNEAGQELVLREVSAEAAQMGSVVMRGVLGNVSKDVFSPDAALASVALIGASAKSLDILVENRGLFERLISRDAEQKGRTPDEVRREYGMGAAIVVPVMLGGGAAAKAVGQAVARFVAKPGRLAVQLRAKDPAGLGVADVAGNPDPGAILDKVDVTATAD